MVKILGFRIERVTNVENEEAELKQLSHCHLCGRCICNWHSAYSDDDWDMPRRICKPCFDKRLANA